MKRSGLRSDPNKVREWQDRSRKPLNPGVRKRRATINAEERATVMKRSSGWCIVCLWRVGYSRGHVPAAHRSVMRAMGRNGRVRKAVHLHHVLPVQMFVRWELSLDNQVGICAECHDEHERAHRRIPFAALPEVVRTFARCAGSQESLYFERTYPRGQ